MTPFAIFGGTFDPIHIGHLRVAWEAAEALNAQVHLMPANVPPHRPAPIADAGQRASMLEAALAGQERLLLDTRELRREGPSYSIDTLRELRAEAGPQRSLILLLGADAFAGLSTWHEWRGLLDLAHVVVLTRPGHATALPPQLATEVASRKVASVQPMHESPSGKVFDLPVTPLEISASAVRAMLAAGNEPRWLLPDALFANSELLAPYRKPAR
ncbi:MAG: nicotinate-nucleotide adenylyltransferase [Rudaea sp.]